MTMRERWAKILANYRARQAAKKQQSPKPKPVPKPAPAPVVSTSGSDFKSGRSRYTPWAYRSFQRRYPNSHVSRLQSPRHCKGTVRKLIGLYDRLRKSFIPKKDKREQWDTHLDRFLSNLPWFDDCDGFMCTSMDAVRHYAYANPEDCALHKINSGLNPRIRKTKATHGVATVDMDGETWVFDNLKRHLYKMSECPKEYTWLTHMRLDAPGKWYTTIVI